MKNVSPWGRTILCRDSKRAILSRDSRLWDSKRQDNVIIVGINVKTLSLAVLMPNVP